MFIRKLNFENYGMKIQREDWIVVVVISGICIYQAIHKHKKKIHAQHNYVSSAHLTTRYMHKNMEISRISGLNLIQQLGTMSSIKSNN